MDNWSRFLDLNTVIWSLALIALVPAWPLFAAVGVPSVVVGVVVVIVFVLASVDIVARVQSKPDIPWVPFGLAVLFLMVSILSVSGMLNLAEADRWPFAWVCWLLSGLLGALWFMGWISVSRDRRC